METTKKQKRTLLEKAVVAGIFLFILITVSAAIIFIKDVYEGLSKDAEPNGLIRNEVTVPEGSTDLKEVGPDWYTFNFHGRSFVYHKRIAHLGGKSVESLASINTTIETDTFTIEEMKAITK